MTMDGKVVNKTSVDFQRPFRGHYSIKRHPLLPKGHYFKLSSCLTPSRAPQHKMETVGILVVMGMPFHFVATV